MKTTLTNTKDIAIKFALGTKHKDRELLLNLLSENGSFTIQDHKLETIFVNRQEFMKWYESRLDNALKTIQNAQKPVLCLNSKMVKLLA